MYSIPTLNLTVKVHVSASCFQHLLTPSQLSEPLAGQPPALEQLAPGFRSFTSKTDHRDCRLPSVLAFDSTH